MRMTLEQSQTVVFHGLAFGNTTDTFSLENYKSHTTTSPSKGATQQMAPRESINQEENKFRDTPPQKSSS